MANPSEPRARFDALRKQARRWLRALQQGDPAARARLTTALPGHGDPPVLREVQQALAREQGFESWAALKEHHLEGLADVGAEQRLATFLEHACIFTPPTDFVSKWRRAERIRARNPEVATASIHAAVVCGEVAHVRDQLEADASLVDARGGPQSWPPLLYACFGRLPNERAREGGLAIARLLLDAGADARAFFVTPDEWRLRFTALTGAMGQGEMGQPEHPQAEALARLLLERGADPNDGQGLYDTCLVGDETRWFDLLAEHGWSATDLVNWHADPADAEKSGTPAGLRTFDFLAAHAAGQGQRRRLAWLLERGADPDATSMHDGKAAIVRARLNGDAESVALLRRHGAKDVALEGHDAFVAAVAAGDRAAAEQHVTAHPEYREIAHPLTEAARTGQREIVRLLLELGVDPNRENAHGHRALHQASGDRATAELLLEYGAHPRSRAFGGTPAQWACTGGDFAMGRFFADRSRSLLDACVSGHVALARELVDSDSGALSERTPDGRGPLHLLPADPEVAAPLIELLLDAGADPAEADANGVLPTAALEARGADEVADLLSLRVPAT